MEKQTSKKKVRIYGAGGHSQVIKEVLFYQDLEALIGAWPKIR